MDVEVEGVGRVVDPGGFGAEEVGGLQDGWFVRMPCGGRDGDAGSCGED